MSAAHLFVQRRLRFELIAPIAVVVCLAEGWAVAGDHTKDAAVPVAALALILLLRKPLVALVVPFAYLSIASSNYVKFSHLGLAELAVLAGVGVVILRGELEVEWTGAWVAVLIATSFAGMAVAEGHGVSLHDAFIAGRDTIGLFTFWLALALLRHDRDKTLTALGCVACGVAGASVIQELLPSHALYLGAGSSLGQILTPQDGILRVRLPGDLMYAAEFFAVAYLFWGPRRRRRLAVAVALLLGVGIVLSLNRNWLIGLGLGVLLVSVLGRPNAPTAVRLLVVALIGALVLAAASGTGIADRVLSLGNTTALEQGTLADRHYENGFAKRALRAHPITGLGWAPYGAEVIEPGGQRQQRSFIHNQYLGVWLRAGIVGLVALLILLLRGFTGALLAFRREGDWVAAGTAAALAGIAASSAVGIYVQEEASALTLATLAALAVIHSKGERSADPAGEAAAAGGK